MHVVWICHRDLRDFLSFDDKAHMERKKADDRKIEPPSEEHLKDVFKPQEEHFRRLDSLIRQQQATRKESAKGSAIMRLRKIFT